MSNQLRIGNGVELSPDVWCVWRFVAVLLAMTTRLQYLTIDQSCLPWELRISVTPNPSLVEEESRQQFKYLRRLAIKHVLASELVFWMGLPNMQKLHARSVNGSAFGIINCL